MRRSFPLVVAALLSLAACAEDEPAPPTDEPAAEQTTPDAEEEDTTGAGVEPPSLEGPVNNEGIETLDGNRVEMAMLDFAFDPTFVQASSGTSVTVEVSNEGDVAHTFTSDQLGVDVVLNPGEQGQAEVELPSDGPVEFVCTFHEAQGMRGAFFFQD